MNLDRFLSKVTIWHTQRCSWFEINYYLENFGKMGNDDLESSIVETINPRRIILICPLR